VFTGIVEELGTIESLNGSRLRIAASVVLDDVTLGASIAVNGCCLTVVEWGSNFFDADLSQETLDRTSLQSLRAGDPVNLERPVRLEDRLGGHLVQGHVDAVGQVVRPAPNLQVSMPAELLRYVVEKGSVTIDGVSLTVVEVLPDGFTVALIPHTCDVTTFGTRVAGDFVNLEVDVMAKYAESLLAGYLRADAVSTTDTNHEGAPQDE
jgi:riboflavin synthase